MAEAYVSIGSNVARERNLGLAIRRLRERYGAIRLSSVYESEAVGFRGESFYNLVAGFESAEPAQSLVAAFRAIEAESGRKRRSPKYGPRTLDLDLLLYGDLVCARDGLRLPRDEILRYAFVLRPLAEVAGALRHPLKGKTMAELWAQFDDSKQPTRRLGVDPEALDVAAAGPLSFGPVRAAGGGARK